MRCLVTGGAGFIGSHLVDRLLKDGHDVIVLDNLSTGRVTNLPREVEIIEEDISITVDYINFLKVDWVFHLAGLADIVPSIEKPLDYFQANVTGTVNTLEAARAPKVKRFIYTASSSCYGDRPITPTDERVNCNPQYPYALTKYLGEQCVLHWSKLYNLPAISLRLFNVYGPRMYSSHYGGVFKVFLAQRANNKPLTIVGEGTQRRDFIYVSDVVDALIKAAEVDTKHKVLNIGSGNPLSINYLTELIGGEVEYLPKRPGEPEITHADITSACWELDWKPKVTFEEGVKIMLEHLDDYKNEPVWTKDKIEEVTKSWFKSLT